MRLVHDQECLISVGDGDKLIQRREIAIHAVEAFDHDPRCGPFRLPRASRESRSSNDSSSLWAAWQNSARAGPRAFMNACVNERIEHKKSPLCGNVVRTAKLAT